MIRMRISQRDSYNNISFRPLGFVKMFNFLNFELGILCRVVRQISSTLLRYGYKLFLQVVVEAADGGGRSTQAIVIVNAMDPSRPSPVTLSPLPGMETFTPSPRTLSVLSTPVPSSYSGSLRIIWQNQQTR